MGHQHPWQAVRSIAMKSARTKEISLRRTVLVAQAKEVFVNLVWMNEERFQATCEKCKVATQGWGSKNSISKY